MNPIEGRVLTASTLDHSGIRHGFFTREGGVSGGVYASLNAGYGSDDARDAVRENRRRISSHLGANAAGTPIPDITTVYQVHSARALIIDAPFSEGQVPEADALVTRTPGLAIGALAADCTPILFADPSAMVIGAAHAGWRGAVDGIIDSTIRAMCEAGAALANIHAAIGPTIHQDSYEVGPEFEARFLKSAPGNARFFAIPAGGSRAHFDLPGYCRHRLASAGVGHIEDLGQCTYKNESLFFSFRRKTHRKEADYGRQISAIVLA